MALVTAVTDVQDAAGVSLVIENADGTRPALALRIGAGLTVSYAKDGALGVLTVGLAAGLATTVPPTITTDATPRTVATIPIPAGSNVALQLRLIATLAPGQVNANLGPAVYRVETFAGRTGTGAPQPGSVKNTSDVSPPFVAFLAGSAAAGAGDINFSGNSLVIQVSGFAVKEAWTSGHAYVRGDSSTVAGDFVTANGNVYLCTSSGTASGSAPSGTGTGLGTGAVFAFVCVGATVPVTWSGEYSVQTG